MLISKNTIVKKSRIVLNEKSATITEFMKNNKPGRAGKDVARKIADSRWNTFIEARKEIAELLSQFKKK